MTQQTGERARPAARPPTRCPGCGATSGGSVLLESHDRLVPSDTRFRVIACESCDLAYTDPIPADLARHYPEGGRYPSFRVGRLSPVERLRLGLTLRFAYGPISSRPAGDLLDVGCGAGALGAAWARRGWRVSGIEPSAEAASAAAAHGVEVHHGSLWDAPWRESMFDAVIFNHSLEHISEPQAALEQARRWLAPEGLLAVTVPNFASWQRRRFGDAWFQLDVPRHVQHFDRETLVDVARRAGFEPVQVKTSPMLAGLPGTLQHALFGRQLLSGRAFRLAGWALSPLVLASGLVVEGDCLNMTCRIGRSG